MYPAQFEYSKAGSVAEAIPDPARRPGCQDYRRGAQPASADEAAAGPPLAGGGHRRHRRAAGNQRQRWRRQHRRADHPLRDFHVGGRAGQLRHTGRGCRGRRRPGGSKPGHHRRQRVPRRPGLRPAHGTDGAGSQLQPARPSGARTVAADDFFIGPFERRQEPTKC